MAVEFISNKLPSWKAIQSRLQPKHKISAPKKIDLNSVQQRKLGPGCYQLNEKKTQNSKQRFSNLPRFSPEEKLKLIVPNFDRPKTRIRSSVGNFDRTKENFHRDVYLRRFKSVDCVGKLKNMIWKSRTDARLKKLEEKNEKFGKWSVVKMFLAAQKGWVVFLAMVSVGRVMKEEIKYRKRLKFAFLMNSKFLYQISRVVGKFCLKLKKIRKSQSLKAIGTLLIPIVNKKVSGLLSIFHERILFTLESILTKRMLKRLHFSWKRKMFTLKNHLNGLILIYKSRLARLFDIWNKIQTKYNQNSNKLIIPTNLSMAIIRKYLLAKLKQSIISRKNPEKSTIYINQKELKLEFAIKSLPTLRIYHKEELIRLYLEVEQQLGQCPLDF